MNGPDLRANVAQRKDESDDVERARSYLDASIYQGLFGFVEGATGLAYVVDAEAMALLGQMLDAGLANAYQLWRGASKAVKIDAAEIAARITPKHDLSVIRAESARLGDFVTVMAIDLLGETIESLFAPLPASTLSALACYQVAHHSEQ